MKLYKHVLIAIDLHPNCDNNIIQRAMLLAEENAANVSIIHAIEHINAYGVAEAYSAVLDVEAQLLDEARAAIAKLGEKYHISADNQFVEIGSPKSVILNKAEELNADLIVVGSHGRHGLQLLLGSTASAVIHHAGCDVLAIRIRDEH